MRDEHPFTESEIKCLMIQLLKAVAFLHKSWIIHRDLKMSNLLYNRRGVLKVGDFGLARFVGDPPGHLTPTVVTLWYRAPELLLGSRDYGEAIDLWSAGCIFGEFLLSKPLFPGKTDLDQIKLIFGLLGVPTSKIWPSLPLLPLASKMKDWAISQPYNNISTTFKTVTTAGHQLMDQLLTYDPEKRVTAENALSHAYFMESPLPKTSDLMPTFPSYHMQTDEESRKRKRPIRAPSPTAPKKRRDVHSTSQYKRFMDDEYA